MERAITDVVFVCSLDKVPAGYTAVSSHTENKLHVRAEPLSAWSIIPLSRLQNLHYNAVSYLNCRLHYLL